MLQVIVSHFLKKNQYTSNILLEKRNRSTKKKYHMWSRNASPRWYGSKTKY